MKIMESCSKSAAFPLTWLVLLGMFVSFGALQSAEADETKTAESADGILLLDSPDPQRTTRVEYTLKIAGTLSTPSTTGASDWSLSSSGKFAFAQRRFASDARLVRLPYELFVALKQPKQNPSSARITKHLSYCLHRQL